jgi:hypothetical protein
MSEMDEGADSRGVFWSQEFAMRSWTCSRTVAQLDHGARNGISLFYGLILLFLALFRTNGMGVIRALHSGWVIGGFNGANARTLLRPLDRKDLSANHESLIP